MPTKYKHWCDNSGRLQLRIRITDAITAHHRGECYDDCKFLVLNRNYIQRQLRVLDLKMVREYLKDAGIEGVDYKNPTDLMVYLLWVACGDILEQSESTQFEAQREGSVTYYNGPCARGHDAPRYASNGNCVQCMKEYNARYTAKYRSKKKETV